MTITRAFPTTGAAYHACQTGLANDGDILIIAGEGVIGLADAWPVALTAARGELHAIRAGCSDAQFSASAGIDLACITEARCLVAAVGAAEAGACNYVVSIGGVDVQTVYAASALHALAVVIERRPAVGFVHVRAETPGDASKRASNEPHRFTAWRND